MDICPRCGASNPVPESGLAMRCNYCDLERPVPDAPARRKRVEKAKRAREKEEKNARDVARREQREKKKERRSQQRAAVRWFRGSVTTLIPFIFVGAITWHLGLWKAAFGDSGGDRVESAAASLSKLGYTTADGVNKERSMGVKRFYVDLEKGQCYALLLASGERMTGVSISGLKVRDTSSTRDIVVFRCAEKSSGYEVHVRLGGPSRFSWALLVAKGPPPSGKEIVRFGKHCKLYSEPKKRSKRLGKTAAHAPFFILERQGKDWTKVRRYDDEQHGWVRCLSR